MGVRNIHLKTAIERVPTSEMLKVGEWLDEPRAMINASESMFQMLDEEEGDTAAQTMARF